MSVKSGRFAKMLLGARVEYPTLKYFMPDGWCEGAANFVHMRVKSVVATRGRCNIFLTGGTAARKMYNSWARNICTLENVDFYFGDERCVSPKDPESNYGLAMATLFKRGMPRASNVHRMKAEEIDRDRAADRYSSLIPDPIDIMLLGVGEDGHIASLFPHSTALQETQRQVVYVDAPKKPNQRLTITPVVVRRAQLVIVLAAGASKATLLRRALQTTHRLDSMPAQLALRGVWLLDSRVDVTSNSYVVD